VSSASTVDELLEEQQDLPRELGRLRGARWVRRATLLLFAVIVAVAAVGLLGEQRGEVTADAAGYRVRVGYPSIVRNGPPTHLDIEVRRDVGFDAPVEVSFDASYLAALEQVEISPAPDSEASAGDDVVWTFSPPAGEELTVRVTAEVASGVHFSRSGHAGVRERGRTVAQADFTSWVWP
jgi:hypothetical protein